MAAMILLFLLFYRVISSRGIFSVSLVFFVYVGVLQSRVSLESLLDQVQIVKGLHL